MHPGGRRASALPRPGRRREPGHSHHPHWTDQAAGLAELRRVARRRVVILTWDPDSRGEFWLTAEYFAGFLDLDLPRFPSMAVLERSLGAIRAIPVPIPRDCQDGFLGAFWRRPEAYLDPAVRGAISGFTLLDPEHVRRDLARLADDLRAGHWEARHAGLRERESLDLGYRLVVAERPALIPSNPARAHGPGATGLQGAPSEGRASFGAIPP